MIVHRFVFSVPVQMPGRAPATSWEPAALGNGGYTATRCADGWLFVGPIGQMVGLSSGGSLELDAIGADTATARLAVMVPHAQVTVQWVCLGGDHPVAPPADASAPTPEFVAARAKPPVVEPGPPVDAPPVQATVPVVAVAAPPAASRRRAPMAPPPPPPPSVGWVDE